MGTWGGNRQNRQNRQFSFPLYFFEENLVFVPYRQNRQNRQNRQTRQLGTVSFLKELDTYLGEPSKPSVFLKGTADRVEGTFLNPWFVKAWLATARSCTVEWKLTSFIIAVVATRSSR